MVNQSRDVLSSISFGMAWVAVAHAADGARSTGCTSITWIAADGLNAWFDMEESSFLQQIVGERRGGWCYQRNGLLTAALREIGFKVTRVASCIKRDTRGEDAFGDHLIGIVDLDKQYVVDTAIHQAASSRKHDIACRWTCGHLDRDSNVH
jgi:hypothetical protein